MSQLSIRDLDHATPMDHEAMQAIRGGWSLPYLYNSFMAPGGWQSLNPQPLPPKESSLLSRGIIIVGG